MKENILILKEFETQKSLVTLVIECQKAWPDLVLVLNDELLKEGIVDGLFMHGILAFGPHKTAYMIMENIKKNFVKNNIEIIFGITNTDYIFLLNLPHGVIENNEIKNLKQDIFYPIFKAYFGHIKYYGFFIAYLVKDGNNYTVCELSPKIREDLFSKLDKKLSKDIYPLLLHLANNEPVCEEYWQERILLEKEFFQKERLDAVV